MFLLTWRVAFKMLAGTRWRRSGLLVALAAIVALTAARGAGEHQIEPQPLLPPPLTDQQRFAIQPNELGYIPILMYHVIAAEKPADDDGYTRTIEEFRADLKGLYDQGYFVIPLRDVVLNRIAAPAGKHPIVLTFDDGTAGNFRYLIGDDGTLTIDPNSAIGILEAFFADYPDFGRGGYFAVPPTACFDWEVAADEPEQTGYCGEKLAWLADHGYEVGNHSLNHTDLADLDNAAFWREVAGGWSALQAMAPNVLPDILALPYGSYPDPVKHWDQINMLRDGFPYDGERYLTIAALKGWANPAYSPASTNWDPIYISRIRAFDGVQGSSDWLAQLEASPFMRYTSDGDPGTITAPTNTSPDLGVVDLDRLGSAYTVVLYDPATGAAT